MHMAVKLNRTDYVDIFLKCGADINSRSYAMFDPFVIATYNNQLDMVMSTPVQHDALEVAKKAFEYKRLLDEKRELNGGITSIKEKNAKQRPSF